MTAVASAADHSLALSGDFLPARVDDNTLDAILCDVASGTATHIALSEHGVTRKAFYWHLAAHDEAGNRYLRAKRIGVRAYADDSEQIQDESPPMVQTKFGECVDAGWVTWQRNRVALRQWHLSKLMPKVYGDKLELSGDRDNPVAITVSPQDDKL